VKTGESEKGIMGPRNLQALSSLICGAAVLLATPGSYAAAAPSTKKPIQQVVVIVQENRTPDNLFHGLPNADIANTGLKFQGGADYTDLHTPF